MLMHEYIAIKIWENDRAELEARLEIQRMIADGADAKPVKRRRITATALTATAVRFFSRLRSGK